MKKVLSFCLCFSLIFCLFAGISVEAVNADAVTFAYNAMQTCCDPVLCNEMSHVSEQQFAELKSVAEGVIAGCDTDSEKIRKLCLYVADRVYYDFDYAAGRTNNTAFDAYDVYDFQIAVCQGYAELFLALCNTVNIPCMHLYGTDHVYNAAYDAQNERWVITDPTWVSGNEYAYGRSSVGSRNEQYCDISLDRLCRISNHELYSRLKLPYNGVFYGINEDGTLSVTGAAGSLPDGVLTVPETGIEGHKVTKVSQQAFYNTGKVTEITLPDGVTEIDDYAFYYCSKLKTVRLGKGLTRIGHLAFSWCANLTDIRLPDGLITIGQQAFQHCFSLSDLTLPATVTTLDKLAFTECFNLERIVIPEATVNIADDAFSACNKLTIYGTAGSYAQTYAAAHGIPFQVYDSTVTFGDVNDDGMIDTADLLLMKKCLAGLVRETDCAAGIDANNDGTADTTDLLVLKKYLAGLIDALG